MRLSCFLDAGGMGSAARLAREIKAQTSDLAKWRSGQRPVPAHQCVAIEKATDGAVTRKDLRPNDWADIWPELKHE